MISVENFIKERLCSPLMSTYKNYQQHYLPVVRQIDSQPPVKSAFEKILALHLDQPEGKAALERVTHGEARLVRVPANLDAESKRAIESLETKLEQGRKLALAGQMTSGELYHFEFALQAAAMYECNLDEKTGPLQEALKAYAAHGRMNATYGWRLGKVVHATTKQRRLRSVPWLQALANAFMSPFDEGSFDNTDWIRIVSYAEEKFPELNAKRTEARRPPAA